MLRTEVIAQIDAEIARLESAREILAGARSKPKRTSKSAKVNRRSFGKKSDPGKLAAPVRKHLGDEEILASTPLAESPRVRLVPPKRRAERRKVERPASPDAPALSGLLPSGPIVVSADEARKAQVRSANVRSAPIESEISPSTDAKRSLGSLVQAFERSSRLNDLRNS